MAGGIGVDLVDYGDPSLTDGVRASADGIVGDDGPLGEGDTIGSDVENLRGTPYGDVLVGNFLPNTIQGRQGADRVFGGNGNDTFLAGEPGGCSGAGVRGADHFDGGAGLDTVDYFGHGGRGDDLVIGNNGVNTLSGNEGDDVLHGDVLNGGAGVGDLFGGAGFDRCDLGFDGRIKYYCELRPVAGTAGVTCSGRAAARRPPPRRRSGTARSAAVPFCSVGGADTP